MTHWRTAALESFPEQREVITADDEEYASYSFFFWLRDEFENALFQRDICRSTKLLAFVLRSLRGEFCSDGEDIPVAAGVSFAEHLYDDHSAEDWEFVLSLLSRDDYSLCMRWLKTWLDTDKFNEANEAANRYYR